jgi:hypothetical protein
MKVPILILDKPNKNNRVYPFDVFERALKKARTELINEKRFLIVDKMPESLTVNLLNVVGVINDIEIDGNKVMADVSFFPDKHGIREAIMEGKLHLRTSGMATLTEQADGTLRVSNDYELISCFLTDDPA